MDALKKVTGSIGSGRGGLHGRDPSSAQALGVQLLPLGSWVRLRKEHTLALVQAGQTAKPELPIQATWGRRARYLQLFLPSSSLVLAACYRAGATSSGCHSESRLVSLRASSTGLRVVLWYMD